MLSCLAVPSLPCRCQRWSGYLLLWLAPLGNAGAEGEGLQRRGYSKHHQLCKAHNYALVVSLCLLHGRPLVLLSEIIFCACPQQKDLYDDQIAARTKLARDIKYGDVVKFKLQSGSPSAAASAFAIEKIHTIRLPKQPSQAVPSCDICGFQSTANTINNCYKVVRNHIKTVHPEATPQANLAQDGSRSRKEIAVLAGATHMHPNYFDGLLTEKFAELAKNHHEYATDYYADETHKRQLNSSIDSALRGYQACAHGVDFCIWDAKKQCWFGSCKEY